MPTAAHGANTYQALSGSQEQPHAAHSNDNDEEHPFSDWVKSTLVNDILLLILS